MAKVERAIRVSVLDENTCDFCDEADGIVVEVGSPEYEELKPPAGCYGGGMCRCLYAYIRIDEPVKPILTPKNKLPVPQAPFITTPITPQEIKIEDEFIERMGLTDMEIKSIASIERKEFSAVELGYKEPSKQSVIIRLRNGKEIILYDSKIAKTLTIDQQEFIRELINHYDRGLTNLDKMNRIIVDFKSRRGIMGGFYPEPSKPTAMYMNTIIKNPDFTSMAGTLYHEGVHAYFYGRYEGARSLINQRANEILDKIKGISTAWNKRVEKSIAELLRQPDYILMSEEELLARYVGMIKHKDVHGSYLVTDLKSWGRPDKELRKILTAEGLL